ncbi:MAG: hypothetical protein JSR54_17675, partial [Proteobacteria bacterium]|nr:hypothetical protein [Pseudomonadota bacterium]
MSALRDLAARARPLAERLDRLSLRERALVFGAGVALIYVAWQALLMDPIARRARGAEQRLVEIRRRGQLADEAGLAASQDPAIAAAARNRALDGRLHALDAELAEAARGYVAPERMAELLRELIAGQQGLRLVSLRNLPPVSLSHPGAASAADATVAGAAAAPADRGPFLHPVELVVEGDYLS